MAELDHRTKVVRDLMGYMPPISDLVTEEIDGILYRYKPEPKCRICSADSQAKDLPHGREVKQLVDTLILFPKSFVEIASTIEPFMEEWPERHRIGYKSIRTHMKRHLPWDKLAMRMIVERWASEQRIGIMDAAGRMLLTEQAWLEGTIHKGWESLIEGNIQPTWADVQRAWERKSELQTLAEGEFSVAYLLAEADAIITAIREEVPPEMWTRIAERLAAFKRNELPAPAVVVEGEVTEEELFQEIVGDTPDDEE